jgi:hypothetical protein
MHPNYSTNRDLEDTEYYAKRADETTKKVDQL